MIKGEKAKGHTTGKIQELCQVIENLSAQRSSYKQFTEQLKGDIRNVT